jgi:hypothetical protein
MAELTQARTQPPGPPGSVKPASLPGTDVPVSSPAPTGPIDRLMSLVIRKLAWSKLSDPKVAVTVSAIGLLLGMVVGATAPNTATLPTRLPLSLLPYLSVTSQTDRILAMVLLYAGDVFACLGLAGMLWAHSQGWRPKPRHLFLASAVVVAVMVSLTPVGSSDTASYAAYGRIAAQGGNPYVSTPAAWLHLQHHPGDKGYFRIVGEAWTHVASVYGPVATAIQRFAASIGGADDATTIWILMILNGAVFLGVGWLLLKTSDDPVRATLFWTANPVIIQQLVSGGHLDTFVAAAAICAIQVARRVSGLWGDVLIGILLGLGIGIKATAALVALGLAIPMLRQREWLRVTRIAVVALMVVALEYSSYGLRALKPLFEGAKLVILPSPWRFVQMLGVAMHLSTDTIAIVIGCLWPIAMFVVAWLIYQRISSDQPAEVVAPFALTFAWILVYPWVFPWYTAIAWVALTQVPRNRMTRWLTIVTVLLACWHSGGGQHAPGQL